MSNKSKEHVENSEAERVHQNDFHERNVLMEEQEVLKELAIVNARQKEKEEILKEYCHDYPEASRPTEPVMKRKDDRLLGNPSPLENRMLHLQKQLEVCKQNLDASRIDDFEHMAPASSTVSKHESENLWAAAATVSLASAKGCHEAAWTPNCMTNGMALRGSGGSAYDSDAPFPSCRAVATELPSPIKRTTEAFRLSQGPAV